MSILSYNHVDITVNTVNSVLAAGLLDIVLLHNGSENKNREILQKFFPQITHLVLEKNRGFAGGINYLLQESFKKNDWVVFLTNDTEIKSLPQDWPSKPGIYCPKIFVRQSEHVDSIGGHFDPLKARLVHCKSVDEFNSPQKRSFKYAPGSAFLLHKNCFEKVGGFDESLHTYWEDVDFSVKLIKAGFDIWVLPDLVLNHKIGKTCRKDIYYTNYLYHRNRKIISLRYSHNQIWTETLLRAGFYKRSFFLLRNKKFKELALFKNAFANR